MSKLIKIVNLEVGLPTVEQARSRLNTELSVARKNGVRVLKIIHGYGSSGVGGDLRIGLQAMLRQMADRREIQACIYGENWRKADEHAWALLKQIPELKEDRDLSKGNRGITIVLL
jgi:DNA-nicking Smr family endonuclease